MAIRVLIVDDHGVVRDGLRSLLQNARGIELAGEAKDGNEALQRVSELVPDVVIMDISLPGLNGIEATREIRKLFPECRVVMLSIHPDIRYVHHALRAGADGYVRKDAEVGEIVEAVRVVHQGERYLSRNIDGGAVEKTLQAANESPSPIDNLSERERQVFQLVVEGKSNAHIAEILSLSVKTVETYRSRVMRKLSVQSLPDLVKLAIKNGITSVE